ncbi:CoA transferase [Variovorax paradoxus]|nr:CoA transferase [Variovorax paradoxus]MBT2305114.1 CoA transferase [Variovorax paradoxus]
MPASPLSGSLQGLRILDLSRVLSGPYCTQILADHGADVLKVEPPSGDETRTWGPPFVDDVAAYFQGVNRNKRSMCLDLAQPEGKERLLQLLTKADVLVENFKAGTMARWGLGHQELAARFPALVTCSISGFGGDGPLGGLPGYDAAVQAMSGLMSVNGQADGDATRVGIPIVDMVTGLNAVIGILIALQERSRSGRGQHVELSLFDCALSILHPHTANFLASGKVPQRTGNAHPNIAPYDTVATRTAPIFLAVGNDGQFRRLCEVLGSPELADMPEFLRNRDRCVHRAALTRHLHELMCEQDGEELAERLMKAGVPCSIVQDVRAALDHPQTLHREMLVSIGGYRGIASPIRLGRTPATYRMQPPRLNEHQLSFDFAAH